jgi:hypothetical protein
VAESPAVAREYQSALSNKAGEILLNGKKFKPSNYEVTQLVAKYSDNPKELSSKLNEYVPKYAGNPYSDVELAQQAIKTLNAGGNVSPASSGSLYTIDLPDPAIARMLDWDKPLSEQKNVMDALRLEAESRVKAKLLPEIRNEIAAKMPRSKQTGDWMTDLFGVGDENIKINRQIDEQAQKQLKSMNLSELVSKEMDYMKPADMNWNMTGKQLYEIMSQMQGSPVSTSETLRKQGVPGIRYLDQASRQANVTNQNTSNFVVFPGEEDLLRILNVEGGLLAP